MSDLLRICAIVPSHNHCRAVPGIVAQLTALGLPVFIIDDGSNDETRSVLGGLADPSRQIVVTRLDPNQGKGGAVLHGFQLALAAGYTHALQIDADGQHDLGAVARLVARARAEPSALIAGVPVYDRSVPIGRAIGRYVTHVWVWIETLSFDISDSMCGLRIYPLAAVAVLLAGGAQVGRRMDFDTEIMVRLFWNGVPVLEEPVAVVYPVGNTSNFDLWRDNLRISAMHTRLFFGMLRRLPQLLRRHRQSRHWAWIAERGASWGLEVWAFVARLLGRSACLALMSPVILYFYLTGREQRLSSWNFLRQAAADGAPIDAKHLWFLGFRHFMGFAGRALDTFLGWTGAIAPDAVRPGRVSDLAEAERASSGALFIIGHIGNVDLARALLDDATRRRLLVLVHTRHAERYNQLLRKYRPDAGVNTRQVTDLGPALAMELKDRIERGDWVVIAGDRVPINSDRTSLVPFLGRPAPFSHGPYILGSLLECPVYTLFCLRHGEHHVLDVEKLADRIDLPRQGRQQALDHYAGLFASRLETYARQFPLQWYNFFNFWNPGRKDGRA